jgi:L-ectoine synthase
MKVIRAGELPESRIVRCPNGGFISHRFLLESDGMGYTITRTVVPPGRINRWHYKHHLESCYCITGRGLLVNEETKQYYAIAPDTMYVLDKNDAHTLEALETMILICVFNPPLKGAEVHGPDGAYAREDIDLIERLTT